MDCTCVLNNQVRARRNGDRITKTNLKPIGTPDHALVCDKRHLFLRHWVFIRIDKRRIVKRQRSSGNVDDAVLRFAIQPASIYIEGNIVVDL